MARDSISFNQSRDYNLRPQSKWPRAIVNPQQLHASMARSARRRAIGARSVGESLRADLLDVSLAHPTTLAIKTTTAKNQHPCRIPQHDPTPCWKRYQRYPRQLLNLTRLACLPQVLLRGALHLAQAALAAKVQRLPADQHLDGTAHAVQRRSCHGTHSLPRDAGLIALIERGGRYLRPWPSTRLPAERR